MASVLTFDDRRRAPRSRPPLLGVAEEAVLRPAVRVSVIAISAVGALMESATPVRPGARTELALEGITGDRRSVNVFVLRCWVAEIAPVRYRCVVCFESPVMLG